VALYGVEIWTFRKVYKKYVGSFAVWCRRRMEKISMTSRERNKEILQRINKENILHRI
jgi:adenylyl- and sulfurtransferase ThiI